MSHGATLANAYTAGDLWGRINTGAPNGLLPPGGGFSDVSSFPDLASLSAFDGSSSMSGFGGLSGGIFGPLDLLLHELIQALSFLQSGGDGDSASDSSGYGSYGGTSGITTAAYSSPTYGVLGASGQRGRSDVAPIGAHNPAGIAQQVYGQSAMSLMASQRLPMQRGVDPTECCANFVSACLQKAGLLSPSEHSNLVTGLRDKLLAKGWHSVDRRHAKPGDVCVIIKGNEEHVEMVARNDNGALTLIGSNNTGPGGTQQVGYDTGSGNGPGVTILSP